MRTFIAIELDKEAKDLVYRAQQKIKEKVRGIKWVEYENFHITLKFLGEVGENKLEEVKTAIEKVSAKTEKFVVTGDGLGAFPSPHRARILFFGIKEGKEHIFTLFEKLEQELAKLGFQRETRPYHPHITIGRGKRRFFDVSEFLSLEAPFKQSVKNITLLKSTLTSEGAIYDILLKGELR